MIKSSKLSVTIHDVEFAKDFQYTITVQYEGMKKQTDVSALARNPIFSNNTFFFDPPSNHTIRGNIIFIASVLLTEEQPKNAKNIEGARTKVLGEASLDLTPFGLQPTETYNLPIRQQIKFVRSKEGKQISVGRFIASFKIVPQEDVPVYLEEIQDKKIQRNQIFTQLPDYDDQLNFKWRIKIDIRQAINIPSLDGVMPQAYVEVGWTEYKTTLPEPNRIYSTNILNSNHPEWNQIFLISNPAHVENLKGFIYICLKQKNSLQDISKIYVPVESMGHFVPYNLKIRQNKQSSSPIDFYLSLVLQTSSSSREKLHDIIVADITFDPLIAPSKQMNLALTCDTDLQPRITFLQFSPNVDTIERVLQFDQAQQFTYFLTQTMKIPPIKSSKQYRAACIMTIPESFLSKGLNIYLVFKNSKTLYSIGGVVQSIQKDLIDLLLQKTKRRIFFTVRPHPDVKMGKCQIELCQKEQVTIQKPPLSLQTSRINGQQTASQRLMKDLSITNNDSLIRNVSQNNQIIARILRELDDKSQALREAASEISDLRSRVKLLQTQNSILRRKALQEQDQLVTLVQKQIDNMNPKQLKEKIIKISQLYKSQRVKTKDLQKAIQVMQPQVSNTMQLNSVIISQKNNIQLLEEKIHKTKKDLERINIYKETIKKQEKVILKLQKVMRDGAEQIRNARQTRLQLEQLKRKATNFQGSRSQSQQIQRLQRVIAQLQKSGKGNMQISNVSAMTSGNSYQLQFKLHQAQTRVEMLEQQLEDKAKSYAREIAMYKLKIAEKDAILDGFSNNNSYN